MNEMNCLPMKIYYRLLLILSLLPLIGFGQIDKKVLIIGIDGCRSDALISANTPNLDHLIETGIYSPDALNDDITISGPGWSAILCGVWSDKHLVTGNNFQNNNYIEFPSFYKYLNDFDSSLHTVSICHWAPINNFIIQNHADFKVSVNTDMEVATLAASYLSVNDPDVIFLHFDDADHAGHSYGFSPMTNEYIAAIEGIDLHIGAILAAIGQRPTYNQEDWLILVSTDHGGIGTGHGGNSLEEQNVFVIASSPSVQPSLLLKDSTILPIAINNCLGDTLELQFDGIDDRVQIPSNSFFDFGTDQDFTVECRVRTNLSADVAIVGNKNWDSGNYKGFVFSFKYPSGPQWKVNIGDGTNRADINTGGAIADNDWHTLSVSFDRDGFMKMYQDGILLDSADISHIGDINTSEGLFFGADIFGEYAYSGSIAEIRVWDTILTSTTINDWHCSKVENIHPQIDKLIGYWKLNDNSDNSQVTDFSGNNNHGIVDGANWISPDSVEINYDYSATPRLTDIVPTALSHLCIPIQENWQLDGYTLIPYCSVTNIEEGKHSELKHFITLFPNPAHDYIQIDWSPTGRAPQSSSIEIFNATGSAIYQQTTYLSKVRIPIGEIPSGVYYASIRLGTQQIYQKFIKQ